MLDRRTFIAGGVALGAAGGPRADPVLRAKARAIDAVPCPPGFNGVLAFGRGGRVEHLRCLGLADVEAGEPVTAATRFMWGSATKWVTAAAVLRLAEQGRLALDAPIGTYLPGLPPATAARVRLRHLLSNTSGIPDLLARRLPDEPGLRTSDASAAAIAARFAGGELAFPPGEGWDYSALNWAILAVLLHRVTGADVPDLVGRLVFRPLGMGQAGFAQADRPPLPRLAVAYDGAVPPARKVPPVPPFLAASGTAAGTAADALRAAHGIFHGPLLRPSSRAELTTVRWPAENYALGGRVRTVGGEPWAWEAGKLGGYRALIAHRLSASETVAIFNTTDMAQSAIGEWAEAIVRA